MEQVKQFKEEQHEIQKHLHEELTKEKEKNKCLESKLNKSKLTVNEWKSSIIAQLDNLKSKLGEVRLLFYDVNSLNFLAITYKKD